MAAAAHRRPAAPLVSKLHRFRSKEFDLVPSYGPLQAQAFTPAFTMALLVAMGHEPMSTVVAVSVLMIAVGTGASVLMESAMPTFHLLGFMSFVLSSASEAGRVVLFQVSGSLFSSRSQLSNGRLFCSLGRTKVSSHVAGSRVRPLFTPISR